MPAAPDAVDAALRFLAARQLPGGVIRVRVGLDLAGGETDDDDDSLFGTSLVAGCLAGCGHPLARRVVARGVEHLRAQMQPGGVWRHWTATHPQFAALPADLDDTACISAVLRRARVAFPDNRRVLLANRDRQGRFLTWIVPRWPPPAERRFWRVALRRLRHPLAAWAFWRHTSAAPGDVDAVVNANVLRYLGDGPHAAAVVDYLAGVLRDRAEDRSDKWYRSPFVLYYAVGRIDPAAASALHDEVVARIRAAAGADGRIGSGPLETALALCTLRRLGATGPQLAAAGTFLAGAQAGDGSWPAEPFYFGGPRTDPLVPQWGSAELTTGFCVEALDA